ncbi:MAG: YDG domain-containing protein [Verrucomicrobiae bacterium]|nr:YDG domain-containing protein [Verrucomicrobiae bacterium]
MFIWRKESVFVKTKCPLHPLFWGYLIKSMLTVGCFTLGVLNAVCQTTNTINFTYANRATFLTAGWDFLARNPDGTTRNTEITSGTVPPDVSYDQLLHSGYLRVPADVGDLWASGNDTRNTIFRDLETNWMSVRLEINFAPTQPYQQANLMIYQDDDNYIEVGRGCGYPADQHVGFTREINGAPQTLAALSVTATNLHLRLDRDLQFGDISSFYSLDGTNWVALDSVTQGLLNPRLGIWVGGSFGDFPNADLRRLQIITADTDVVTSLALQPTELVFSTVAGQTSTNYQKFRVNHRGPQRLAWSVTNLPTWLTLTATNGLTTTELNASVNATGLAAGVYQATLQFVAAGAANNPQALEVSFVVNPESRVTLPAWQDGKSGALSISVDDGGNAMYGLLRDNGYSGTYIMNDTTAPSYYNDYYTNGMELGCHLVDHLCMIFEGSNLLYELEANINGLAATTIQPAADIITLAWPCGIANGDMRGRAGEYFLAIRGYNINQLEDPTPSDFMELKSFNSHEHDPHDYNAAAPDNPADLKTVVDAAIAQGKWANLVFHGYDNDDGAVAYSVGKDIWVSSIGAVTKYIYQRDRTVISDYQETVGEIRFDCYRLPIAASRMRSFESAIGTNDTVTLAVSLGGVGVISNLTVNGISTTNYTTRTVGDNTMLYWDTVMTTTPQQVVLTLPSTTNLPPVLAANADVVIAEGQLLTITNTAVDPEGDAMTFSLGAGVPAGMNMTPDGILTWTPDETCGGLNYTVQVIVTDNGFPSRSATNSFTVTVDEWNETPILPSLANRISIGQALVQVVNTATDADLPANSLSYALLTAPANASINSAGIITWSPSAGQVPSTNLFTTVVTDVNPTAVNATSLSATNQFTVVVLTSPLVLPEQADRVINELTTLTVTNTATDPEISDPANIGSLTTNLINFTYASRAALLADGWSFIAKAPDGLPRDTEQVVGAVVSYDQALHPGSLRVPVDEGDLWQSANDTRNSLFRSLSSNWVSMKLNVSLAPTQNYQQVHLAAYQDDDNWVHVGLAYNDTYGGTEIIPIVSELNGNPFATHASVSSVTNLFMRLDRDPVTDDFTGLYSFDDANWETIGTLNRTLTNACLALWTGGSPGGFPNADYYLLEVVVTNAPKRLTYALLDPPAGASIDADGVITWTPTEAQGPGTHVLTTVVTDNGVSPLFATNSFTVVVSEVNSAPTFETTLTTNIVALMPWSTLVTATDSDQPANGLNYDLVSGPAGLTVSSEGLIQWTPTINQAGASYPVQVRVTDYNPDAVNEQSLSATNEMTIVVGPVLTVTANNANRTYGAANPSFTASYSGFIDGDDPSVLDGALTLTTSATSTSPVGEYAVTASGLTSDKYLVVFVPGTLTIEKQALTVTAVNDSKVYDGTTGSTGTPTITTGSLVNGQTATFTQTFDNRNVGTGRTLIPSGLVNDGNGGNNYSYTFMSVAGGEITPRTLTVVGLSGVNKVYDGSASASASGTAALNGVVSPDVVTLGGTPVYTFASASVGTGIAITTTGYTLTGAAAGNYTLTPPGLSADITAKGLTVVANAKSKVYGTANPVLDAVVTGAVGNEVLDYTLTTTATEGSGVGLYLITVTLGSNPNYNVTATASLLTVRKAPLTVKADDQVRGFGEANPALTISYSGFVNGEDVGVLDSLPIATTAATTSSPAGSYPITVSGGSDNNYSFVFLSGVLTVTAPPPVITAIHGNGAFVTITWESVPGREYQLQYTDDLSAANWQDLGGRISALGSVTSAEAPLEIVPQRFYRVELLPMP